MLVEAHALIHGSKEAIWAKISDIENAAKSIRGIQNIEILEKPPAGLVGLKWRETRTVFGKSATEVMWITDAVENQYYRTRAESHGCIYVCELRITEQDGACRLTMSMQSRPQGIAAKLLMAPMSLFFKGAVRKMLQKDLDDIKDAVEQHGPGGAAKR